jgi:superfamily II DNA or RNA helicase
MNERIASIFVENHAQCKADDRDIYILSPALQFAVPGLGDTRVKSHMNTRYGTFLTGFLPRILRFCNERKILVNLIHNEKMPYVDYECDPHLDGIQFRKDQSAAIHAVLMNDRGIILAPTGTGKTVVMAGVISCYPSARWLVVSHTSSLILQTAEELKKYGLKSVGIVGAGTKGFDFNNHITVGTRQKIAQLKATALRRLKIDGIVIDEAHHVVSTSGEYAHILKNLPNTCVRIGFTATLPTTHEKLLAMEGLLGPVISELTWERAAEMDILARPKVIIRRVPTNSTHAKIHNFRVAYLTCVVENRSFHRLVISDLNDLLQRDLTVLILVIELEHAYQLIEMAAKLFNIDLVFVHGGISASEKDHIRKNFTARKIRCVVATTSWREGINIPTLGAVQLVGQGKSELKLLQEVGRGLRKTSDKKHVLIYDYFNPNNRNLIAQFGERLCLYMDRKWLSGMEE